MFGLKVEHVSAAAFRINPEKLFTCCDLNLPHFGAMMAGKVGHFW
jgi:hypothetical protein